MDSLRKLTRILLIGMGVYLLIEIASIVIGALWSFFLFGSSETHGNIWQMFLMLMFYIVFMLLIIFFLIKKADFWAERIVGLEEEKPELPKGFWIPVAFRLAAVFAGMLCTYHLLINIITTIYYYIYSKNSYSHAPDFWGMKNLVTLAVELALVIYLLCGAPHFVRWHIKKILEQSETSTKQTDAENLPAT